MTKIPERVEAGALDEKALAAAYAAECELTGAGNLTAAEKTVVQHSIRAYLASLPEAPAVPVVKELEWSESSPPDHSSFYDHTRAASPFGAYCIEWKSWKEYPGFSIEGPGNFLATEDTLDGAKLSAQADFESRIRSALATPPAPTAAVDGQAAESLDSQINRLANFIMAEVPGEPSQSDGAVDTAIRWMRSALKAHLSPGTADIPEGEPVAWLIEDSDGVLSPQATTRPQEPDPTSGLIITPLYRPSVTDAGVTEALVKALKRFNQVLTYPVSTEIDPKGYAWHAFDLDKVEFVKEEFDAALSIASQRGTKP